MFLGFRVKYPLFCQIVMRHEHSRKMLEKYPNLKFHENPSIGNRVVPCGRQDRDDEADSSFWQICPKIPTSDLN